MDFGYFTLSDNHYENNARSSNQFVADIAAEALLADKLGMHSAWIGEHHFNSLGVLSCPDLVLAYVAANTTRIRLAPAELTRTSTRPNSAATCSNAADTSVLDVTSVTIGTALGPRVSAISSSSSLRRASRTTVAPSYAKR